MTYGCEHKWMLRDDDQYECDSCHVILTSARLMTLRLNNLDILPDNMDWQSLLRLKKLPDGLFQLVGSQNAINEFLDSLAKEKPQ